MIFVETACTCFFIDIICYALACAIVSIRMFSDRSLWVVVVAVQFAGTRYCTNSVHGDTASAISASAFGCNAGGRTNRTLSTAFLRTVWICKTICDVVYK